MKVKNRQERILSSKTLTYFLQLADTMNYTQAAQILGITQPALTQQIKKLEHAVDAPLFYSVGKKLRLSKAGIIMLETTHQIYELLNQANDKIQQTTSAEIGQINIGVMSSIEDSVLNDFMVRYYSDTPEISVNLNMLTRKEVWDRLENNEIDLGIMYLPDDSIKNWNMYETNPIYSDELYYLHHDPHLADKKKIKLIEIDKSNLVMFPEDYYITRKLRRVFRDSMIDFPKIVSRFSRPRQIYQFCSQSNANTILSKAYLLSHNLPKMYINPIDPSIKFNLSFIYRKDKKRVPRIEKFLKSFYKFLDEKDYETRLKEKVIK